MVWSILVGFLLLSAHSFAAQLNCTTPDVLRDSSGTPLQGVQRYSPAVDENFITYTALDSWAGAWVTHVYDRTSKMEYPLRFVSTAPLDSKPEIIQDFVVFHSKDSGLESILLGDLQGSGFPVVINDNQIRTGKLPDRLTDPEIDYDPLSNRVYVSWGMNFFEGVPFTPVARSCYIDLNLGRNQGSCFGASGANNYHIDRWVTLSPGFPGRTYEINMASNVFPFYVPGNSFANGVIYSGGPGSFQEKPLFISHQMGDHFWTAQLGVRFNVWDAHLGTAVVSEQILGVTETKLAQYSLGTYPPIRVELAPSVPNVSYSEAQYSRGLIQNSDITLVYTRNTKIAGWPRQDTQEIEVQYFKLGVPTPYKTVISPPPGSGLLYASPSVYKNTVVFEEKDSWYWPVNKRVLTSTCTLQ